MLNFRRIFEKSKKNLEKLLDISLRLY
jgi:hypothetical protein